MGKELLVGSTNKEESLILHKGDLGFKNMASYCCTSLAQFGYPQAEANAERPDMQNKTRLRYSDPWIYSNFFLLIFFNYDSDVFLVSSYGVMLSLICYIISSNCQLQCVLTVLVLLIHPNRNRKVVNYSQFNESDDAGETQPPNFSCQEKLANILYHVV